LDDKAPLTFSSYRDDLEEAHDYELLKKDEPAPTASPSVPAEAENEKDASGKIPYFFTHKKHKY
jgi:hypothetical protein